MSHRRPGLAFHGHWLVPILSWACTCCSLALTELIGITPRSWVACLCLRTPCSFLVPSMRTSGIISTSYQDSCLHLCLSAFFHAFLTNEIWGLLRGIPYFMAPEFAHRGQQPTVKTDMFSVGVLAY